MKACNFIKKRLQHRCFPMNISKLLRTTILKNNSKRLLQCFCFTLFPGFFVLLGTHKVQMCFKYFSKAQSKMRHSIAICDQKFVICNLVIHLVCTHLCVSERKKCQFFGKFCVRIKWIIRLFISNAFFQLSLSVA